MIFRCDYLDIVKLLRLRRDHRKKGVRWGAPHPNAHPFFGIFLSMAEQLRFSIVLLSQLKQPFGRAERTLLDRFMSIIIEEVSAVCVLDIGSCDGEFIIVQDSF